MFVTCNLPGDAEIQKQILYYRQVLQETREANEAAANKTKQQFEKRNKVKVYEPKETVLVDLGKRTKVKKVIDKVPAVIIQGYAGSQYRVVWLAGVKEGQTEVVDVDRIEPFHVRQDSDHTKNINIIRDNITKNHYDMVLPATKKGQKRARDEDKTSEPNKKRRVSPTKPSITNAVHVHNVEKLQENQSVPKKRSESHFWKLACEGASLAHESRRKPKVIADMVF